MKFTYETQGAITYLVCELEPAEQIDGLTLGMLTNNHIVGLAPVLYTEMNGQRFFKYNVSAKVSADQFFSGNMNRQRTLQAFQNIISAICIADEYMIDPNCFSVIPEHIFLNVSSCEAALICVPVVTMKDVNTEASEMFKNILVSSQFDPREGSGYTTQLLSYVNDKMSFNIYGMRDLVTRLQNSPDEPAAPAMNNNMGSFNATISIDDMPGMGGGVSVKPQINNAPQGGVQPSIQTPPAQQGMQTPPVQPSIQTPHVQQGMQTPPVQPSIQTPHVQPNIQTPPVQHGMQRPPVQPNIQTTPAYNNHQGQGFGAAPAGNFDNRRTGYDQGKNIPGNAPACGGAAKPPVDNGPGFAIPNQPGEFPGNAPAKPPKQPKQPKNPQPQAADKGDKKMSLLGLLANYNKENAAIYKAQKEAEKKAKMDKKNAVQIPVSGGMVPNAGGANRGNGGFIPNDGPVGGYNGPYGTPGTNRVVPTGGSAQGQPQYTTVQNQPVVNAVPVQNSFNETTVLSDFPMGGGETTVLNAAQMAPQPHLTRVKTGERININKPVFRIGKEKSYVDYFIVDNTAISRSHANIITDNGEYFVEDTNSTNHTYVNGKIINSQEKVKIVSGDKIRLANEDFTFSI